MKKRRIITNYYNKITQGNHPLTIENIHTIENVFSLGSARHFGSVSDLNIHFSNKKDELTEAISKAGDLLDVDEEEIEFNEDDRAIEQEMADLLFSLPQEKREKLQKRIPLKILKRLKKIDKEIVKVKNINEFEEV